MFNKANKYYPWLIWGLGAAFFCSEYFARVAPSVMVPELMSSFHVTASSLGALSAFFYYAYVGLQVPVGALVDRFGPRFLLATMSALCGMACFLFADAQSLAMAELSRFLMGAGAAFAFVGTLKLATLWFSPTRFGLIAGITQALGMLGAAIGEGPVSILVNHIGWRPTMELIGGILLVIALLIALIARNKPDNQSLNQLEEKTNPALKQQFGLLESLIIVLRSKAVWLNAIFVGFLYAPTAAFAELWGPSYLRNVDLLHPQIAAAAISMIFIGWTIGGPIAGLISDAMRRRKPMMYFSAAAGFLIMSSVLFIPHLSILMIFILLFLYGLTNVGVATAYAVSSEIIPRNVAGTSMGFANMASVIIGALFQPIIGWIIDWDWNGHMANGIPIYSMHNYQIAMLALPICFLISLAACFFVRETHCKGHI